MIQRELRKNRGKEYIVVVQCSDYSQCLIALSVSATTLIYEVARSVYRITEAPAIRYVHLFHIE